MFCNEHYSLSCSFEPLSIIVLICSVQLLYRYVASHHASTIAVRVGNRQISQRKVITFFAQFFSQSRLKLKDEGERLREKVGFIQRIVLLELNRRSVLHFDLRSFPYGQFPHPGWLAKACFATFFAEQTLENYNPKL